VRDTSGKDEDPGRPIRVFVVDDHVVVRRGMRAFFAMLTDIEVVGEAADGKAALDELAVAAASGSLPDSPACWSLQPFS